jgi:hypothetical protein
MVCPRASLFCFANRFLKRIEEYVCFNLKTNKSLIQAERIARINEQTLADRSGILPNRRTSYFSESVSTIWQSKKSQSESSLPSRFPTSSARFPSLDRFSAFTMRLALTFSRRRLPLLPVVTSNKARTTFLYSQYLYCAPGHQESP